MTDAEREELLALLAESPLVAMTVDFYIDQPPRWIGSADYDPQNKLWKCSAELWECDVDFDKDLFDLLERRIEQSGDHGYVSEDQRFSGLQYVRRTVWSNPTAK